MCGGGSGVFLGSFCHLGDTPTIVAHAFDLSVHHNAHCLSERTSPSICKSVEPFELLLVECHRDFATIISCGHHFPLGIRTTFCEYGRTRNSLTRGSLSFNFRFLASFFSKEWRQYTSPPANIA